MKYHITNNIRYEQLERKDLTTIVSYINGRFNQMHMPKEYKIYTIHGYKVIFWACGALVLHDANMYHISSDDGNWFLSEENFNYSTAWIPHLINLFSVAQMYLIKKGYQYHYADSHVFCGYGTISPLDKKKI